jgi:hypothetical protein
MTGYTIVIEDSDELQFAIQARAKILEIIKGAENASQFGGWDNTKSNYQIRQDIQKLRDDLQNSMKSFGVHAAKRHGSCGVYVHRGRHRRGDLANGFILELIDGTPIESGDSKYDQFFSATQGYETSNCPCRKLPKSVKHYVQNGFVILKSKSSEKNTKSLFGIMEKLYWAIESSEDGNPRSGIREDLMDSMLHCNDVIIGNPIEDVIKQLKR